MIVQLVRSSHDRFFSLLERAAGDWFLGLGARLVFSSVLLMFFLNSAATKLGSGFPGMFVPTTGAYAQILPPIAEAVSYDTSQISFVPWGLIVLLGTYAEVILPCLILVGLFTRLASLAMIGFIAVMSFVDVTFHGLDAKSIGGLFDRMPDAIISDQRLMWVFLLIYLAVRGAGAISLDAWLARRRASATTPS